MSKIQERTPYDIGLVGLGVMGSNFVLNLVDHGFSVACYNRKIESVKLLPELQGLQSKVAITHDFSALCRMVRKPRSIVLLVPAGDPVDEVIENLVPHLDPGDLLIDSGNSHFSDTDRRGAALRQRGLLYIGMGMSGGASGARHGPSLMPGGSEEGYERVRPILQAVAAQAEGTVCVAYMGNGSAGHYVKMVHNGIEYALMQLIAESYDLMRRGLGLHPDELHAVYRRWNQGPLKSFLVGITADIFQEKDDRTGRPLIDLISDRARQKGTGLWTVSESLTLQTPVPTITAAVMMRHLSGHKNERTVAARALQGPDPLLKVEKQTFIGKMENALHCAGLISYAQGMALLRRASEVKGYHLHLRAVARVWLGGCIIRADMLHDILAAFENAPDLANLLIAPSIGRLVESRQSDWREVVQACVDAGIPIPGLMAALAYWDGYRSDFLPANLIMAQRDYFGAHTYERLDEKGTFHTQWGSRQAE